MTSYSGSSRNHFAALFYFLFFSASLLLLPMPTMAQKWPTRFMDRPERRVSLVRPSFTYNPSSPTAGQEVQFTDTSKGFLASWQWDFGDGTTSTDQHPSHTFSAPGSYRVKLTAGDRSASKEVTRAINVLSSASITSLSVGAVSFMYAPASLVAGSRVQFTDTSTNSPTSWLWDFGDGGVSSIQNPSYTYRVAGSYAVTLTTRSGSDSSSVSKTVTIYANVITAASPSFEDVSSAISSAKSGDTVIVPAGNATWTDLVISKRISLIGSGIGSTNITFSGTYGIEVTPDSSFLALSDIFRVSGFTFKGAPSYAVIGFVQMTDRTLAARNIRIDNNRFENTTGYPLYTYGNPFGVVDNNQFAGYQFLMLGGVYQSSWSAFYENNWFYGTEDNLYIEDNTFSGSDPANFFAIESGGGGRWCFRHNIVNTNYTGNPAFDQHGNQSQTYEGVLQTTLPGLMLCEIYENTFNCTSPSAKWEYQRGGKLLMYNNTGTGGQGTPNINQNDQRHQNPDYGPAFIIPTLASTLTTRGQYTPHDCYFWNNAWNGARVNAIEGEDRYQGANGYPGSIAENETFWNQNDSFDGTKGIGVGLLSARPATCTTGVGYWATDTKTLYKAMAPNTWTVFYTPYTYPHPLRSK